MKTASPWPWAIAGGLALVAVANAIMITIAFKHPSVPIVDDHWQEALNFDAELQRRSASAKLGWQVHLQACDGQAECARLQLRNDRGDIIHGARIHGLARRLDTGRFDRTLSAEADRGGTHRLTGFASSGLHLVDLDIAVGGEKWTGSRRIFIGGGVEQ